MRRVLLVRTRRSEPDDAGPLRDIDPVRERGFTRAAVGGDAVERHRSTSVPGHAPLPAQRRTGGGDQAHRQGGRTAVDPYTRGAPATAAVGQSRPRGVGLTPDRLPPPVAPLLPRTSGTHGATSSRGRPVSVGGR